MAKSRVRETRRTGETECAKKRRVLDWKWPKRPLTRISNKDSSEKWLSRESERPEGPERPSARRSDASSSEGWLSRLLSASVNSGAIPEYSFSYFAATTTPSSDQISSSQRSQTLVGAKSHWRSRDRHRPSHHHVDLYLYLQYSLR